MKVRVFPLRRNGRRTERAELSDGVPGDRALLLRGFQSVDGAAYVQEWRRLLE